MIRVKDKYKFIIKWLLVWVFVFFLNAALPVWAQQEPIGTIIGIQGTVEVQAGTLDVAETGEVRGVSYGPWQRVQPRQQVFVTDKFRTSRKSRLKIVFIDKSMIALGPNSNVSIEKYVFSSNDKLRQALVKIAKGVSMYIVNKNQNNPDSSFEVITSTGNIAARGTKGFLGVSAEKTLLANQAGSVFARNVDPAIPEEKTVGPMMKTRILVGQPPTDPVPLTLEEVHQIQNMVMGWLKPGILRGKNKLVQEQMSGQESFVKGEKDPFGEELKKMAAEVGFATEEDYEEFYEIFEDTLTESCIATEQ